MQSSFLHDIHSLCTQCVHNLQIRRLIYILLVHTILSIITRILHNYLLHHVYHQILLLKV